MNSVRFPPGYSLDRLTKSQNRQAFSSGQPDVDDWLHTKAMQQQQKHLSVTKVLLNEQTEIVGYYTLVTGQVDFGELPASLAKKLPHRLLPIAILAWLGVAKELQGQGLGRVLLAQALRDCYEASRTFAFIAVILDCVDARAKAFYEQFGFSELPGHAFRLFLSATQLEQLMCEPTST